MFLMEPYDTLASAFRYRRLSEAARQSLTISASIQHRPGVNNYEPSKADVDALGQLTKS
jgi:hypothetical protein